MLAFVYSRYAIVEVTVVNELISVDALLLNEYSPFRPSITKEVLP